VSALKDYLIVEKGIESQRIILKESITINNTHEKVVKVGLEVDVQ
jgi:hypothetical protein